MNAKISGGLFQMHLMYSSKSRFLVYQLQKHNNNCIQAKKQLFLCKTNIKNARLVLHITFFLCINTTSMAVVTRNSPTGQANNPEMFDIRMIK